MSPWTSSGYDQWEIDYRGLKFRRVDNFVDKNQCTNNYSINGNRIQN